MTPQHCHQGIDRTLAHDLWWPLPPAIGGFLPDGQRFFTHLHRKSPDSPLPETNSDPSKSRMTSSLGIKKGKGNPREILDPTLFFHTLSHTFFTIHNFYLTESSKDPPPKNPLSVRAYFFFRRFS